MSSYMLILSPSCTYPSRMVDIFVIFWGTFILFSIWLYWLAFPVYTGIPFFFFLHPCRLLLSLSFLVIATVTDVPCLIVVLICIALLAIDTKHFFLVFWAFSVFVFVFERYLFTSFAQFFTALGFSLLSFWVPCIFWMLVLYQKTTLRHFLYSSVISLLCIRFYDAV